MFLWIFFTLYFTSTIYAEIITPGDINNTYLLPVLQNGLLRFMIRLNRLLINETEGKQNVVFSPINIYELAVLVAIRTAGVPRKELCHMLKIPKNIDTMKVQKVLKKVLEYIHRYSSEDYSSARLSWKDGLQLKDWRMFFYEKLNKTNVEGNDIVTELVHAWIGDTSKDPSVLKAEMALVMKLLVTSPMYFHETWKVSQYDMLFDEIFNADRGKFMTEMIAMKEQFPYVRNDVLKYEAISIPYKNRHFAFYIVLPHKTTSLNSLVQRFHISDYNNLIKSLYHTFLCVDVKMPLLNFKWARCINSYMQKLGSTSMFSQIIIDKLATSLQLAISHETIGAQLSLGGFFLPRSYRRQSYEDIPSQKVNMESIYFPDNLDKFEDIQIRFHVNRPFMFFIYNHDAKLIMFSGLVNDPSVIKG